MVTRNLLSVNIAIKSAQREKCNCAAIWIDSITQRVNPIKDKVNQSKKKSQVAPPAGKRQLTGGRKAKQLLVPEERNTTANAILSHWKGFEN